MSCSDMNKNSGMSLNSCAALAKLLHLSSMFSYLQCGAVVRMGSDLHRMPGAAPGTWWVLNISLLPFLPLWD